MSIYSSKKRYTVLFCRDDSAYKKRSSWDVYDKERDALSFKEDSPIVAHPPCRTWGQLAHMAFNATPNESKLALWAIKKIRKNGGILEHPDGSKLFKTDLPDAGMFPDEYGGFTILIDQYDFGHVAHKMTKLYFCGLKKAQLPDLPPRDMSEHFCENGKKRSICGNVAGTTRCTQYQREYTPEKLIDFFESVLNIIQKHKIM